MISITGTFDVKTLVEIAQLVSFNEEPPDALTNKQLPRLAQKNSHGSTRPRTIMALTYLSNFKENPHHKTEIQTLNRKRLDSKTHSPKTHHALAAESEGCGLGANGYGLHRTGRILLTIAGPATQALELCPLGHASMHFLLLKQELWSSMLPGYCNQLLLLLDR